MHLGVNVPNFGPGTSPAALRRWAQVVEGLGFDLLMVSDHVVIEPEVAALYPPPFYEPFTTLSWMAAVTTRIRLGTTVLVLPYRHPLLTARMAANLNDLSGGRFVLGVGVGWARQEYQALGVPFEQRGPLTDAHLETVRAAWVNESDDGRGRIPIWVGGNSDAGIRRAVRRGDAWHPIDVAPAWLDAAVSRMKVIAAQEQKPTPGLAPRIKLKVTDRPVGEAGRLAGVGTLEQIIEDLGHLQRLGSESVLLDPFGGDPEETRHPESAWSQLATVVAAWNPSKENR